MSVAYAVMNAGDISIRDQDSIKRCPELESERFGSGHVYYRVLAITGASRSFRFDQIESAYIDRKVMKYLVDSGHGKFVSHAVAAPSLLLYVWRDDYEQIINHNQHHGYNFVILDQPAPEIYGEHGILSEEEISAVY